MTEQNIANSAKMKNIIDMALTFTAMMRVFSKGSKVKIVERLGELFSGLDKIRTRKEYENAHTSFCGWFTRSIYTAEKKLKNGHIKRSKCSSYGQAAKVLDISIKVYVYYCSQPSPEVSRRIIPFLNGAVDTPIMKYLISCFPGSGVRASTIEKVDEKEYRRLQTLVGEDIAKSFRAKVFPVQYDDIMWYRLNRA